MLDLEKCNNCYKKTTSNGCIDCEISKYKDCIIKLHQLLDDWKESLKTNKSNINKHRYIFYFNYEHYNKIKDNLDISGIPDFNVCFSSHLVENTICEIVDTTKYIPSLNCDLVNSLDSMIYSEQLNIEDIWNNIAKKFPL